MSILDLEIIQTSEALLLREPTFEELANNTGTWPLKLNYNIQELPGPQLGEGGAGPQEIYEDFPIWQISFMRKVGGLIKNDTYM